MQENLKVNEKPCLRTSEQWNGLVITQGFGWKKTENTFMKNTWI
jgi:hypothetical protein